MRTKTLLTMAALAAGALTSMAQSSNVYSLNIVGYVNVPAPHGYTFQCNPLDASPDNSAASVIANPDPTQDYSGPMDSASIQIWTGAGFSVAFFDSVTTDSTTGFVNGANAQIAAPVLSSGLGYLINNGGASNVITYVGTVRTGTNTFTFPARVAPYAVGCALPLAGGVISGGLGFNNPDPTQDYSGPLDGSLVEFLRVNPTSGAALGYSVAYFDSVTTDSTTGFANQNSVQIAEPILTVGQGFFFSSGSPAGPYAWTQILNP